MKILNRNRANILLLFTRDPFAKTIVEELEYYISDDDVLVGFVAKDRIDETFHACLFDRDSRHKYCLVDVTIDCDTIMEARRALEKKMQSYVRNNVALQREKPANDFFAPVAKPKQWHPAFKMLKDNGFFYAAKKVIEELSYHFEDRDGNFVDQLQSKNGFDARIWELYLWCYLREEEFNFNYDHEAPDFMVEKSGQGVAIEAVHINRKQKTDDDYNTFSYDEKKSKLENEIPLLYGSSLYSKLKHTYDSHLYWELEHVKDKPLLYAIADFHGDMSMTWSFPGIVSILYGIDQKAFLNENGSIDLVNEAGRVFQKKDVDIQPLFLDEQFRRVSAVMFSTCGTLSKFNRMGVQAGYGNRNYTLFEIKMCYNSAPDAIVPDVVGHVIDETCNETWADGIQIFHNPFADIPLDPSLFPHAGHHFYKDGVLHSNTPHNHIISTMTYNIKNMPVKPAPFHLHSNVAFDSLKKVWRM